MILPEYFESKVKEFCKNKNIRLINGNIPIHFKRDVDVYIENILKSDKARTKNKQYTVKSELGFIMNSMIGNLTVSSPIEVLLWDALEKADLTKEAIKQYPIGKYQIDIAYPYKKLAIECDGREYHRENQLQLERDQKRDKYLARKGWRTLRIEGIAIYGNIDLCIWKIREGLQIGA